MGFLCFVTIYQTKIIERIAQNLIPVHLYLKTVVPVNTKFQALKILWKEKQPVC